jgi:hypothetical protein
MGKTDLLNSTASSYPYYRTISLHDSICRNTTINS